MRKSWFAMLLASVLAACAGVPQDIRQPDELFADRLFGPPTEPVTTDRVFAVSDAMKHYLAFDIALQLRMKGAQTGLIDALARHAQLKLEYDSATTKTASEAFAARSGNCLSLVIMTAALAKELKLPVQYQSAILEETWSRSGNLLFSSGHVNVTVGPRMADLMGRDLRRTTIDFLPPEDLNGMRTRVIEEATVLAMYANNRAAEALAVGRLDDAYAWSREAVRNDPGFIVAYNTLGVVYLRHGDLAEADRVFSRVLEKEPQNTRALANLVDSYEHQGRGAEAGMLRARLAALEPYPPFHFFYLGLDAMRQQDWVAARELFAREVARADYNHEFHFWLGVADWRLGDVAAANTQLRLAMDTSTTRDQRDLYAAKLAWLQSRGMQ